MSENFASKQTISRKRFSEIVTPEVVRSLYWSQGLSGREIARIFGVKEGRVYVYLRKHDILDSATKRAPARTRMLIKNYHLSQRQKEFLFGTLLGDGNVKRYANCRYARLQMVHGLKQRKYLEWKAVEMQPLISLSPVRYGRSCESRTVGHPDFDEFLYMFYSTGKKCVPMDLSLLTPFAIAVWFCDDGTVSRDRKATSAVLCVCAFSIGDCDHLVSFLKSAYGIDSACRVMGGYNYIVMNSAATVRFHSLIDEYIPNAMAYKRLDKTGSSTTTREAPSVEG